MPYIYSITEQILDEDGDVIDFKYHIVPKEVAELHDNGHWLLTNQIGRQMTGWLKNRPDLLEQLPYGKGVPLVDSAGQVLAAHDLVMTTISKYADLKICEVVSFTPKMIRVRNLARGYETTMKSPSDLIKVDSSLFL